MIYSMPATAFNDITKGNSGGTPPEYATKGYDLATGLGSPIANYIVALLAGPMITSPAHIVGSIRKRRQPSRFPCSDTTRPPA